MLAKPIWNFSHIMYEWSDLLTERGGKSKLYNAILERVTSTDKNKILEVYMKMKVSWHFYWNIWISDLICSTDHQAHLAHQERHQEHPLECRQDCLDAVIESAMQVCLFRGVLVRRTNSSAAAPDGCTLAVSVEAVEVEATGAPEAVHNVTYSLNWWRGWLSIATSYIRKMK